MNAQPVAGLGTGRGKVEQVLIFKLSVGEKGAGERKLAEIVWPVHDGDHKNHSPERDNLLGAAHTEVSGTAILQALCRGGRFK